MGVFKKEKASDVDRSEWELGRFVCGREIWVGRVVYVKFALSLSIIAPGDGSHPRRIEQL